MKRYLALMGLTLTMIALAPAQDTGRVVVPARNSTRPRLLKVSVIQSSVTVKTHAGKDVIIEAAAPEGRRREERTADGLRRIDIPRGGFQVEEQDNVITIHTDPQGSNLTVTVPVDTSVQVKSANGGITVEGVHGEIEVGTANGKIELTNVSGTVVAETNNGSIKATLDRVDQSKPLSFSSLNGSIDVALPADTKATLKMRSFHGSIWTDFDMNVTGNKPVTSTGGSNAKFEVKFDRTMYATINGGGVEANFSTLNGRVVIKKK